MIIPFNRGGVSIAGTIYQVHGPLTSIAIYNNSPVSWNVSEQPGGPVVGVCPAFYALSIPMNGNTGWCLTAVSGAAGAASTLSVFAYLSGEDTAPLPFGVPFGPNSWGSGAGPGGVSEIAPGDQVLAWQINQLVDLVTGLAAGNVTIKGLLKVILGVATSGLELSYVDDPTHGQQGGHIIAQDRLAGVGTALFLGLGVIISPTGDVQLTGRVTAPLTGPSASALLNTVGTSLVAAYSATLGNGLVTATLTGLPTTKVLAFIRLKVAPLAGIVVGDWVDVYGDGSPDSQVSIKLTNTIQAVYTQGLVYLISGTNTLHVNAHLSGTAVITIDVVASVEVS